MDVNTLLDLATERIRQYLPEDYEMDDISWGENIFQICVFDVSAFPGRLEDRFLFEIRASETEAETADRFNDELNTFVENWR